MKKLVLIPIILLFAGSGFWFYKHQPKKNPEEPKSVVKTGVDIVPMQITSPAFSDQGNIPVKYTCDGDGVNPPLVFTNVPKEAKTLALIVDDPDAPNGTWAHWILWNISPDTNQLAENSVPAGATQGQGSSGQNVYGSLCPPRLGPNIPTITRDAAGAPMGMHHYHFKLYALSAKLSIPSYSTSADLEKAMEPYILDRARLIGLYSRVK